MSISINNVHKPAEPSNNNKKTKANGSDNTASSAGSVAQGDQVTLQSLHGANALHDAGKRLEYEADARQMADAIARQIRDDSGAAMHAYSNVNAGNVQTLLKV